MFISEKNKILENFNFPLSQNHLFENIMENLINKKTFKIDSVILSYTTYTLYHYTNILNKYVYKDTFLAIPKFLIQIPIIFKDECSMNGNMFTDEQIEKLNNNFSYIEYLLDEIEEKHKNDIFVYSGIFYLVLKQCHELLVKLNLGKHEVVNGYKQYMIDNVKCDEALKVLSASLLPLYTYNISKNNDDWFSYNPKSITLYRDNFHMVAHKDYKDIFIVIYNKELTRRDFITLNFVDFYKLVCLVSSIDLDNDNFRKYSNISYMFDDFDFSTDESMAYYRNSSDIEKAFIIKSKNLEIEFKGENMKNLHEMFMNIYKSDEFKKSMFEKIKCYGII